MQKEELLHLHMLMFQIRTYFAGDAPDEIHTDRYNSLEISPLYIHKGRKAHEHAVLTLGDEIVTHIHGLSPPPVTESPAESPAESPVPVLPRG